MRIVELLSDSQRLLGRRLNPTRGKVFDTLGRAFNDISPRRWWIRQSATKFSSEFVIPVTKFLVFWSSLFLDARMASYCVQWSKQEKKIIRPAWALFPF